MPSKFHGCLTCLTGFTKQYVFDSKSAGPEQWSKLQTQLLSGTGGTLGNRKQFPITKLASRIRLQSNTVNVSFLGAFIKRGDPEIIQAFRAIGSVSSGKHWFCGQSGPQIQDDRSNYIPALNTQKDVKKPWEAP